MKYLSIKIPTNKIHWNFPIQNFNFFFNKKQQKIAIHSNAQLNENWSDSDRVYKYKSNHAETIDSSKWTKRTFPINTRT